MPRRPGMQPERKEKNISYTTSYNFHAVRIINWLRRVVLFSGSLHPKRPETKSTHKYTYENTKCKLKKKILMHVSLNYGEIG